MRWVRNEGCPAARFVVTAALGLLMGTVPIGSALAVSNGSADSEKTDYVWSTDLDCALCHETQAASVAAVASSPAFEKGAQEEVADQAAAEKPLQEGAAQRGEAEKTAESPDSKASEGAGDEKGSQGEGDSKDAAAPADDERAAAVTAYAAMHAADLGFDCFTCHNDAEGLEEAHDAKKLNSGKEARRLKKTEVSAEFCQGCHDRQALAGVTADYQGLVDKNGLAVNPHDLPQNDSHAGLACVSCHAAHPDEGAVIQDQAMGQCISCHHAEVFECHTCH